MRAMIAFASLFLGSVALAAPKPDAALRKLIDAQMPSVMEPAPITSWSSTATPELYFVQYGADARQDRPVDNADIERKKIGSFDARLSPDGQSALMSFTITMREHVSNDPGAEYNDWNYRVTEIATKTKDGWRIAAGLWTMDVKNAEANANAKAGKLHALTALPARGDKSLLDAFTKLTTGPLDDAAAKRKDLVVFGSGPKERTVGGAGFAKAWSAAWANKIKIDSAMASTDPKATLGYVMANITLQKNGYTIPFRVLVAFERKTDADPWSVVHVHLAVPQ